jgi:hypothetical protein
VPPTRSWHDVSVVGWRHVGKRCGA